MTIESLYGEIEQSRKTWTELYDLFVAGRYQTKDQRPAFDGQSLETLHRRVLAVFELLATMRPASPEDAFWIIISPLEVNGQRLLEEFRQHTQSVLSQMRSYWRDEMTISDENGNFRLQFVHGGASIATWDASNAIGQVFATANRIVALVSSWLPFAKTGALNDLSGRAEALGDLVRNAENLTAQVKRVAESATESQKIIASRQEESLQHLKDIQNVLAQLQSLQQQGTADLSQVTALVEKIKTVGGAASTLEELVNGYESKFQAFQKQLDDRNRQFEAFQDDARSAQSENRNREEEIDRLTRLADSMISGATTAGLAKSLEDARKRYEDRMWYARVGFLISVALLVVSALPLAAHLLPGLFQSWLPSLTYDQNRDVYDVLEKIVILLPATWLTAFFTKSYAEFFHLEREYAHKAALAMSVDGFKRQAPDYQQEITAEVFLEIRTNPASRPAPEPASHPLYDVLSKALNRGANDKGKSAE